MGKDDELPYIQFYELYTGTYREIIYKALLEYFNDEIRSNYRVSGVAEMPDDKVVIRLRRKTTFDD